jgi:hypothetical protein
MDGSRVWQDCAYDHHDHGEEMEMWMIHDDEKRMSTSWLKMTTASCGEKLMGASETVVMIQMMVDRRELESWGSVG